MSTWEEYHTGVLYLGYVNGPTEGLVIACVVMILSGIYGPGLWLMTLNETPLASFVQNTVVSHWKLVDAAYFGMFFLLLVVHSPAW